jgi:O-antigen ligase
MPDAPDPFLLLVAALTVLPLALAACLHAPASVALGFVAILCLFSASTWGQLQEDNTIYSRGTGMFYFSLLNLLLWVAAAAAFARESSHRFRHRTASPFPAFALAFGFLLCGHLVLGIAAGADALTVLGYNGLLNVLNMALFAILLLRALRDEQGRRRLLLLILALAAVRAAFGLVRYAFFGGDDANPYRNFERLDITLVYFDIADNYIAALAAFCIAWLLLMPQVRMPLARRLALLPLLAMELATVALSFRRSSLIGLVLMSAVLLWQLPWQRRLAFGGIGAVAMLGAAGVLMRERLASNAAGGGFLASLLYDVGPERSTEVSRFYELEAAAQSLQGHWLFGIGSWGSFYGNEDILDYHFGKFDFVHSGFGHLLLKSGVAGLALFVALLAAFIAHYAKQRRTLRGNSALLADAGMAGLLFWMPTLLIGTPVIEFRTMLLLGLTLALPYLAAVRPLPPALPSPRYAAA